MAGKFSKKKRMPGRYIKKKTKADKFSKKKNNGRQIQYTTKVGKYSKKRRQVNTVKNEGKQIQLKKTMPGQYSTQRR